MSKRASVTLPLLLLVCSCNETTESAPPPKRFAAVKKADPKAAAAKFCERTFAPKTKKWAAPPERKLPGAAKVDPNPTGEGWTWVNLWATWCVPCVEEMPLLGRWKAALHKEKLPLKVELWTIDEEEAPLAKALGTDRYPGAVHWLRGEEGDLPKLLAALGLGTDTAIPVHGLVDPDGYLRCVRVGKVGEANYSAIKSIVSGAL